MKKCDAEGLLLKQSLNKNSSVQTKNRGRTGEECSEEKNNRRERELG